MSIRESAMALLNKLADELTEAPPVNDGAVAVADDSVDAVAQAQQALRDIDTAIQNAQAHERSLTAELVGIEAQRKAAESIVDAVPLSDDDRAAIRERYAAANQTLATITTDSHIVTRKLRASAEHLR